MDLQITHVEYPNPSHGLTARPPATDLIIHHTAGSLEQTPLEIDQEHRNIGDSMIAYEFLIDQHGKVYDGRPVWAQSAATYGRNTQSINIAYIGQTHPTAPNYTGAPTPEAIEALTALCIQLHRQYPSLCRTIGHRDVAPMFFPQDEGDYSTACPGDDLYAQIPAIKAAVIRALNTH